MQDKMYKGIKNFMLRAGRTMKKLKEVINTILKKMDKIHKIQKSFKKTVPLCIAQRCIFHSNIKFEQCK